LNVKAGAGALPYWGDESAHRNFLLQLGRSIGGTHFLVIDADEIVVVGNCELVDYQELRNAIVQMKEGDIFVMQVLITIFVDFVAVSDELM
jgi:hypothetical protein